MNDWPSELRQRLLRHLYSPDEFERQRRALETKNEMLIDRLVGTLILFAMLAHGGNRIRHWAPFESPTQLFVVLLGAFACVVLLHIYLRRNPPYRPIRKYLITFLHVVVFMTGYASLARVLPPMLSVTLPVPMGMLLIALSALRYSRGAVFLAGGLAIITQIVFSITFGDPSFRLPTLVVSIIVLSASTLVTNYIVASLTSLHRESVNTELLSRFLPPEVVREVGRHPELLREGMAPLTVTVLFADIHGFTSLSERLPAEEVVRLLTLFRDEVTSAVMSHRGMLDKFIGDAVMAVFGAPLPTDRHARQAYDAAREIRSRMRGLNLALANAGHPALDIGIGLHSGEVLAGTIVTGNRVEYTVIGDTVNVANRLVGLTGKFEVDILISTTTQGALAESEAMRSLGTVAVRGREQMLEIWTPIPRAAAPGLVATKV